ncbi:MAG: secretin N-terminal domain-containing protein, partial [Bryobacteraceae bacterium]
MKLWISTGIIWIALAGSLFAQEGPRMMTPFGSRPPAAPAAPTQPAKEQPEAVKQTVPAKEPANAKQSAEEKKPDSKLTQTAAPAPSATQQAEPVAVSKMSRGGFTLSLTNASLTQVIEVLARHLKLNYILDPRVKGGGVTLNTYGELKAVDVRALLDTVLRMNGAAIVELGDLCRIVPLSQISRMPTPIEVDSRKIPDDERVELNLVFLKYATVSEMSKILEKFLGEGAEMVTYEPANLLLIMDNNRNMRRTMEIVSMFDSDALASQRVRLFEVKHNRPSDLATELDTVL